MRNRLKLMSSAGITFVHYLWIQTSFGKSSLLVGKKATENFANLPKWKPNWTAPFRVPTVAVACEFYVNHRPKGKAMERQWMIWNWSFLDGGFPKSATCKWFRKWFVQFPTLCISSFGSRRESLRDFLLIAELRVQLLNLFHRVSKRLSSKRGFR